MKKILISVLLLSLCSVLCSAQMISLNNVRQQIRPIVKPIWNISDGNYIIIVRDSDNCAVLDEDFIPKQSFAIYRLGWMSPHAPMLFIIVRQDKGYVVNMKRPLVDIIADVISISRRFMLSEDELVLTIRTVLNGYTLNAKNAGGEKILKGPMKPVYPESYLLPY